MSFSRHRGARARPPAGSAHAEAIRLLTRRDFTAAELSDRLLEKGHPAAEVAEAVDQLVRERSVDDRRTAIVHAETAARLKGRGRHRIRRELEARGVAKSLVDDVLAASLSEAEEIQAIRRFLTRHRVDRNAPLATRRRTYHQLLRRGFPADTINKALRLDDE